MKYQFSLPFKSSSYIDFVESLFFEHGLKVFHKLGHRYAHLILMVLHVEAGVFTLSDVMIR